MSEKPRPFVAKQLGLDCVILDFGTFSEDLCFYLSDLRVLIHRELKGLICVQSYNTLAIYGDRPNLTHISKLRPQPTHSLRRPLIIPITFRGKDLNSFLLKKRLSPEELSDLYCSKTYMVAAEGFIPGFLYLWGLDPLLHLERKGTPELVEMGDVGIGGSQTGVYPSAHPGGWHIIGRTTSLFSLQCGDQIQFTPKD